MNELPFTPLDLCPICGAYWSPCGCVPRLEEEQAKMRELFVQDAAIRDAILWPFAPPQIPRNPDPFV